MENHVVLKNSYSAFEFSVQDCQILRCCILINVHAPIKYCHVIVIALHDWLGTGRIMYGMIIAAVLVHDLDFSSFVIIDIFAR